MSSQNDKDLGPDLVGVAVGARPALDDVAVVEAAAGEVKALPVALDGDAVVVGVVPGLLSEAGVALPELHANLVANCERGQ